MSKKKRKKNNTESTEIITETNKELNSEAEQSIEQKTKHKLHLKDVLLSETTYHTIKWFAILTMIIDHIAVAFWQVAIYDEIAYAAMRTIGRLSFPLFAFLLVECFFFTKNKLRHFIELIILTIISEIPFNLLVAGKCFDVKNQNVCLTLLWGFLLMIVINSPIDKLYRTTFKREKVINFLTFITKINIAFIFAIINSFVLYSDYLHRGIILIAMLYFAKQSNHRIAWTVWAFVIFTILMLPMFDLAIFAMIDLFIIIAVLKNSQKEPKCKFIELTFLTLKPVKIIARWFYPFHLFLLWIIKTAVQYFNII